MFRSSVDAFLYLLDGREQNDRVEKHRVASIKADMNHLANGIRCCSVQVLFDDGAGYSIEAYDKEAEELYTEATAYSAKEPLLVVR
jgi:hypothetical protein